jgi:hypothetical protein
MISLDSCSNWTKKPFRVENLLDLDLVYTFQGMIWPNMILKWYHQPSWILQTVVDSIMPHAPRNIHKHFQTIKIILQNPGGIKTFEKF